MFQRDGSFPDPTLEHWWKLNGAPELERDHLLWMAISIDWIDAPQYTDLTAEYWDDPRNERSLGPDLQSHFLGKSTELWEVLVETLISVWILWCWRAIFKLISVLVLKVAVTKLVSTVKVEVGISRDLQSHDFDSN